MSNPLRYRMAIAVLALVAALVALYLHLWKLGLVGSIACTANRGCEVAMTSRWGWFLEVDVALIGVVGYAAILGVALWGAQPSRAWSPTPSLAFRTRWRGCWKVLAIATTSRRRATASVWCGYAPRWFRPHPAAIA